MDKRYVGFGRAVTCAVWLAGLAACGGGGSSADTAGAKSSPAAVTQPTTSSSNDTAGSSHSSNHPSSSSSTSSGSNAQTSTSTVTQSSTTAPSTTSTVPVDSPPKITGTPSTQASVGQTYSFTPSATDSDGDALTFSIANKPAWAAFNSTTGQLSGTPTAADVGTHGQIQISVSDGKSTVSLPQFAINVVQQSNGSLTLSWEAPTQNTDGTPPTNLSGFKIHYGTQSGNYTSVVSLSNSGLTRYVIDNLAPGTYFFAITAVAASGAESALSAEASRTI